MVQTNAVILLLLIINRVNHLKLYMTFIHHFYVVFKTRCSKK